MKLLILGGTLFLGRWLVEFARKRNHEITLFNRGRQTRELFPDLEWLQGDRDGGLAILEGRQWDAVIDTCGYVPRLVQGSAGLLAPLVEHYTYISSVSVYRDFCTPNMDENYPVGSLPDPGVEEVTGESYGPLKALCEQVAESSMPGRVLTVRPGLIVGPYDPTDRFSYWPHRIAEGGEVLAPGNPEQEVAFIDVRDLADWILRMVEIRKTGVYNADGPAQPVPMGKLLHLCRQTIGSDATFCWMDADFLLKHEVQPWTELPLWVPESPETLGFATIDCSRALRNGLTFRPISDTIRDTLRWTQSRPTDYRWRAGLSRDREAELLQIWRAAHKNGPV